LVGGYDYSYEGYNGNTDDGYDGYDDGKDNYDDSKDDGYDDDGDYDDDKDDEYDDGKDINRREVQGYRGHWRLWKFIWRSWLALRWALWWSWRIRIRSLQLC
ncbi:hypothetical protein PQX77_012229, partial [Marasmius sp. AFHP31]